MNKLLAMLTPLFLFVNNSFALDIEAYQLKITDALVLVEKITGTKIIYVGTSNNNKITLVGKDLNEKQLFEMLHATLYGSNLGVIEAGTYYKVASVFKAIKHSPPIVENPVDHVGIVSHIIKVEPEQLKSLLSAITPLLSDGGKATLQEHFGTILITDDSKNVTKIKKIISELQSNTDKTIVKMVSVDYVDIEKMAKNIDALKLIDLNIITDEESNQIFLKGSEKSVALAMEFINAMNIEKHQIVIEVLIAEISESQNVEKGIQFALGSKYGIGISTWGGADGVINLLSDLSTGKIPSISEGGSFAVGGVGKGINIGLIAQAIKQNGGSSILSTPIINTIDGAEAEFVVGKNVPFVTQMDQGDNPFQTVVREDVGLKLLVTPKILSDGRILLDVEQEISSISGSTTLNDIITDKRFLKTKTIADNGSLIILGGLMDKSNNNKNNAVPILSEIPYLGKLFSHDEVGEDRRKLLVFMKPTIIYKDDGGSRINKIISEQSDNYSGKNTPFNSINTNRVKLIKTK